ncbi:hypothetical protein WEH80_38020 [Actinomycetes bacterium KLBMP 9759]
MPDPVLARRGRLNALQRYRGDNDPAVLEARRDLAAEVLAEHVRRIVAAAPPLTESQRERIAALLRPAGREAAAS